MKIVNCNQGKKVLYTVQKQDNLDSIVQKFDINQNNIIRNNPQIDLYEGEVIIIERNNTKQHIVKPMENLQTIAEKYNTTIENLVKINNLKSSRLFVGQLLDIESNNQDKD